MSLLLRLLLVGCAMPIGLLLRRVRLLRPLRLPLLLLSPLRLPLLLLLLRMLSLRVGIGLPLLRLPLLLLLSACLLRVLSLSVARRPLRFRLMGPLGLLAMLPGRTLGLLLVLAGLVPLRRAASLLSLLALRLLALGLSVTLRVRMRRLGLPLVLRFGSVLMLDMPEGDVVSALAALRLHLLTRLALQTRDRLRPL